MRLPALRTLKTSPRPWLKINSVDVKIDAAQDYSKGIAHLTFHWPVTAGYGFFKVIHKSFIPFF